MNFIFQAQAAIILAGDLRSSYTSTGSLATDSLQNTNTSSCALNYKDPIQDIISAVNKIIFRIAVAALNCTQLHKSSSENRAVHYRITTTYQTHYTYMAACSGPHIRRGRCCGSRLQRVAAHWTTSFAYRSPLETAKAFDAPMLRLPYTSNAEIRQLFKATGSIRLKYGAVH